MCFKNKLYRPLELISLDTSFFITTWNKKIDSLKLYNEHEVHRLTFFKISEEKDNYRLIAFQHEEVLSKFNPSQNYDLKDTVYLDFDFKDKVFYNHYDTLQGNYFTRNINNVEQEKVQYFDILNKYPEIEFGTGRIKYLYINQNWCEKGINKHILIFKNNCNELNIR